MAAKRAGVITINLNAGTAQFVQDMERANAKVKTFGQTAHGMGSGLKEGVSQVQATSAALRVFEGGMNGSIRAAERFLATTLHLGPALQSVFSVVGGIALAEVFAKVGKEAYEFLKALERAPGKANAAFRDLDGSLRITNDGIELANARLEGTIAKLEGRRQNTLKVALLEAKEAADKLAESLEKDLKGLQKVLQENDASFMQKLLGGREGNETFQTALYGKDNYSGFFKQIEDINDKFTKQLATLKDGPSKDAALKSWGDAIKAAYDAQLGQIQRLISELNKRSGSLGGIHDLQGRGMSDDVNRPELLSTARTVQGSLQGQRTHALDSIQGMLLKGRADTLQGDKENAELTKPFTQKIAEMTGALEESKQKLAAVWGDETTQALAKASGEAAKAIDIINAKIAENGKYLTADQRAQNAASEAKIKDLATQTALNDAETIWQEKLKSVTVSTDERIRAQKELNAAIGQGYEATRAASVTASLMTTFGKDYDNPSRKAEIEAQRPKVAQEYDLRNAEQAGVAIKALENQIELETKLAKVQIEGAEAVRQVTLALKLREIALKNNGDEAKRLMAAEIAQYNAERSNAAASEVAKLDDEAEATKRLTAAVWAGVEATRVAGLENKYAAMRKAGTTQSDTAAGALTAGGASSEQIASMRASASAATEAEITAARTADTAAHQREVATEAGKMSASYKDALQRANDLTTALEAHLADLKTQGASQADILGTEIAIRDVENQRLKTISEMTLQLGRAQDGVRAFFDDMAQSAEKASTIIYDALHSALDKTSNELANLLTGQKTSWGKMFQSLGHQMVESTIKSGLQRVLGVGGKRDGSSATNALFVQNVGAAGSGQIGDLAPNGDTIAGVGTPAGPGGLLGKLLGLWHKPPAGYGNGGLLGTGQVPKIGTPGGGTVGEPDGSETNPFFVIMSQMAENNEKNPLSFQNQVKKSGGNSPLASFFGGLVGTLLGSSLGISGGGGGGGDTPDVQSSISYPGFASGTDSTPAGAYLVGENGPEIMQGAGKRIYSNQESRRILSSSNPGITYNIDARGTDPHQTEQRVRTALIAVHGSAVSSSMQANVDRAKRVPSRS